MVFYFPHRAEHEVHEGRLLSICYCMLLHLMLSHHHEGNFLEKRSGNRDYLNERQQAILGWIWCQIRNSRGIFGAWEERDQQFVLCLADFGQLRAVKSLVIWQTNLAILPTFAYEAYRKPPILEFPRFFRPISVLYGYGLGILIYLFIILWNSTSKCCLNLNANRNICSCPLWEALRFRKILQLSRKVIFQGWLKRRESYSCNLQQNPNIWNVLWWINWANCQD